MLSVPPFFFMEDIKFDEDHALYLVCAIGFTLRGVTGKGAYMIHRARRFIDNHCWCLKQKRYLINRDIFEKIKQDLVIYLRKNEKVDWEEVARLYMRYCSNEKKRCKSGLVALLCGESK